MRIHPQDNRSFLLVFAVALVLALAAGAAEQRQVIPEGAVGNIPTVANTEFGADIVRWSPDVSFERGVLTVKGKEGVVRILEFEYADQISFDLTDGQGKKLADGAYTFELGLIQDAPGREVKAAPDPSANSATGAQQIALHVSGRFQIVNGRLVAPSRPDMRALEREPGAVTKAYDHVGDWIIDGKLMVGPDGFPGADIHIQCNEDDAECPADILFQVADSEGFLAEEQWVIQVDRTEFRIRNGGTIAGNTDPLTMEKGAPSDSLYVDAAGGVGIGTAVPNSNATLTLTPTANTFSSLISFENENVGAGEPFFLYQNANGYFAIQNNYNGQVPFAIHNTATANRLIFEGSNIGVGTLTPERAFHIIGTDSTTTRAQVDNTNAAAATRILFKIENNGPTQFAINNSQTSAQWTFSVTNSGFVISKAGTGVQEMVVASGGNVTIAGNLTEGSSRATKEAFETVDGREILDRVASLPISTWTYKHDASRIRHLGPMAEDFHAAFGLGRTETGLATLDTSGVALAAIQGLVQENKELKERLERLEAMIAAMSD